MKMKSNLLKIAGLLLVLSLLTTAVACQKDTPPADPPTGSDAGAVVRPPFGLVDITDDGDTGGTVVDKKDLDVLLQNFWQSDTMYDESVLLVAETDEDGNVISAPRSKLLFTPDNVQSVKQYAPYDGEGTKEFTSDDYEIVDGYIVARGQIKPNDLTGKNEFETSLPYVTDRQLSGVDPFPHLAQNTSIPSVKDGLYLPFTESAEIVRMQLSVTYTHTDSWQGAVPSYFGAAGLSKSVEKLKRGETVELFVFGDSISTGANSSGVLGIAPGMPIWPELVRSGLASCYGATVNLTNKSVGGFNTRDGANGGSGWILGVPTTQPGLEEILASEEFASYKPDIAFIGFGMNDAAMGISDEEYIYNTIKMVNALKEKNPDCDIVLIGTMVANPDARIHSQYQTRLSSYLPYIAARYEGVVSVNIADMHKDILQTKRFTEISSNNVNHPNDFMARIYAMNLLSAFIR